jgi:hypothetical protein
MTPLLMHVFSLYNPRLPRTPEQSYRFADDSNVLDLETQRLYGVIVIEELDIAWSLPISPHKLFVSRWPFVKRIACQHTLNAHAHAFSILNRAPAFGAEQVEADDAI